MMGLINVYIYAKLLGGITRVGIGDEERQGSREAGKSRVARYNGKTDNIRSIDANLCKYRILYAHLSGTVMQTCDAR